MRIIQGKYKGRKIEGFQLEGTRPTMERVKESLFAILQENIPNRVCLDLFAGSGNLGIEALSMNAHEVVFVDQKKEATKTIEKNLKQFNIVAPIYTLDYLKALDLFKQQQKKFDIVFLDPPYQTDYIEKSLTKLLELDLLNQEALVVCESDSLDKITVPFEAYQIVKEKKYGDKYIRILKKMVQ